MIVQGNQRDFPPGVCPPPLCGIRSYRVVPVIDVKLPSRTGGSILIDPALAPATSVYQVRGVVRMAHFSVQTSPAHILWLSTFVQNVILCTYVFALKYSFHTEIIVDQSLSYITGSNSSLGRNSNGLCRASPLLDAAGRFRCPVLPRPRLNAASCMCCVETFVSLAFRFPLRFAPPCPGRSDKCGDG